jgi:hypothetical protein
MRKAIAVLLVPVAIGLVVFACAWVAMGDGNFKTKVGASGLLGLGLAGFAGASAFWRSSDVTRRTGAVGPGEQRCGICAAVVPEAVGRWKILAKPGFGVIETGRQFVCASCIRAGWRNILLLLLLAPTAVALALWVLMTFMAR